MSKINPTEKYYHELGGSKVIGFDFDNTCVVDEWPYVGPTIEGAAEVLREILANGHELILFTQRQKHYPECCPELSVYADEFGYNDDGTIDLLTPAVDWFNTNVASDMLFGINSNLMWEKYTTDQGRKIYMDLLIDDHNVGMRYKTVKNRFGDNCKTVDWKFVDKWLVDAGIYNNKILS